MTVSIDKPAFQRLSNRYSSKAVRPFIDEMMEDIGGLLENELRDAALDAYPMAVSQTLAGSAGHRYDRKRGVLTVGFDTRGRVDPVSGKPLSDYIIPIQSFSGVDERTRPPSNPPLVVILPSGKAVAPPGSAIGRLVQWARSIGAENPRAFAMAVAKRFQQIGMPRKPIMSAVFTIYGNRGSTQVGGLESAVHPRLRGQIRSVIQSTVQRIIQGLGR